MLCNKNRIQGHSHCLSHLLPPEKHHLGLRPRGHRYTLPTCPNNLCKSSFIARSFILFSLIFFHLQCLIYSVLYYCITFAFVICLIKKNYQNVNDKSTASAETGKDRQGTEQLQQPTADQSHINGEMKQCATSYQTSTVIFAKNRNHLGYR